MKRHKKTPKRPIDHIAHLRNISKQQSYDFTITSIDRSIERERISFLRIVCFLFVITWILFTKNALCQVWLKLAQWLWKNDTNVESLRQRRTKYKFRSEKLTWAFDSDEIKYPQGFRVDEKTFSEQRFPLIYHFFSRENWRASA